MPRAKQRARSPRCYEQCAFVRQPQRPSKECSLLEREAEKGVVSSASSQAAFPLFSKLPLELRLRIWELASEERRIVAVHTTNFGGLRSPAPPILHVCSESRAIGLRAYTLGFASQEDVSFGSNPLPPRLYFNFERDVLFFRRDWNAGVGGPWCCINQFKYMVDLEDLHRVKAVGFDLKARVCSKRPQTKHRPIFSSWNGLKTLYLGLEKPRLSPDCEIVLQDLDPEHYSAFIEEYCKSSAWYQAETRPEGAAGMEWIKTRTVKSYHGYNRDKEGFCETLSPVRITGL